MSYFWSLVYVLAVVTFWFANLLGLPGNWLIVLATGLYAWLRETQDTAAARWSIVAAVTALAVIGELVELWASAAGVKRVGGSRRSGILAMIGSVLGAMAGVFVGLPVPLVGPVIAALLFAGFGALVGAMLGELSVGRSLPHSSAVGRAAFRGRLIGTLTKTALGAVMAGVAATVIFL